MIVSTSSEMKTKLFALTLLCSLVAGCGTVKNLSQPLVRSEKFEQVVTTVPAQTNHVTVGTNIVEVIVPAASVTNLMTNVVFTVNPRVEQAISTLRELNSDLNPTPTAPFISLALAGLSTILGIVAKVKSDKAKLLPAVIQGVELANNQDVKQNIQRIAKTLGVEDKLNKVVNDVTR